MKTGCDCSSDGCHQVVVDTRNGYRVCNECGVILSGVVNDSAEWFESGKARASRDTFTSAGRSGSLMNRMNLSLNRSNIVSDDGEEFIQNVCEYLSMSSEVVELAMMYLNMVQKTTGILRGQRRLSLRCACVSLACQRFSVGVKDSDICSLPIVGIKTQMLNNQKKMLVKSLHKQGLNMQSERKVEEYAFRFCNDLGFNRQMAMCISNELVEIRRVPRLQSRSSVQLTTVVVVHTLFNSGFRLSADVLEKISGATVTTIIKWYADVMKCSMVHARESVVGSETAQV